MDVVVYRTSSSHNVLTRMGASLAQALQALGVSATYYSLKPGETVADLARDLGAAKTRAVISFNSGGAEWRDDKGRSLHDALDCAFVGWDVDHPSFSPGRYTLPMARRGQVCASASHVAFAQVMGCRATSKLMLPGVDAVEAAPLSIAERPIHSLAAIQWIGEPEVWWAETKGTPAYTLIEGIVARVLADPGADLFAAFQATTAEMGAPLALDESVCTLVARTALFLRQYDRLRLAQAIAATGVPCAIFGRGWCDYLGERPHLLFYDEIDVAELGRIYGNARVVFNLNGANGASERTVQAMAAGAMVVSDYSPLLESSFAQQGAAGFYDRRDMSGVSEMLSLNSDVQQEVADRGRQAVAAAHLWSHKAAELVTMLRDEPFGIELLPRLASSELSG